MSSFNFRPHSSPTHHLQLLPDPLPNNPSHHTHKHTHTSQHTYHIIHTRRHTSHTSHHTTHTSHHMYITPYTHKHTHHTTHTQYTTRISHHKHTNTYMSRDTHDTHHTHTHTHHTSHHTHSHMPACVHTPALRPVTAAHTYIGVCVAIHWSMVNLTTSLKTVSPSSQSSAANSCSARLAGSCVPLELNIKAVQ